MNVVDKQWELIDPNPNVHTLFQQFNHQFFYGKLDSVYVEWSKRMTRYIVQYVQFINQYDLYLVVRVYVIIDEVVNVELHSVQVI